ncbi:hypothetical protein BCR44DRAFT_1486021 [Catenaria anguillulae PL171]|uniref:Ankyrin repeat-containing domain protein n=1 Tax=Catenaria anguillulae PL171 TaxID=765915 RepID=A0A1Y2HKC8_9FUNG|nr:hypothetical protein BCR44DRAFT_1486021 [Catenaria anguillulae PL171]
MLDSTQDTTIMTTAAEAEAREHHHHHHLQRHCLLTWPNLCWSTPSLALLHALGPRHLFPSITDALLCQAHRIHVPDICDAGDTWLLGKLLDVQVPNPRRHIWVARHKLYPRSQCMLEGASSRGDFDTLGYWFRLATLGAARTSVPVRITGAMARRAILGAARSHRLDVIKWLLDMIPKVSLTSDEQRTCWMLAYAGVKATCPRFLNWMLFNCVPGDASGCPVAATAAGSCLWCSPIPTGLFSGTKVHIQNFVTTICKLGHANCFRSILALGNPQQVRSWIPHHALLVATKDSSLAHLSILDVFFQEYSGPDMPKFRVWDGVGINVREHLLALDTQGQLLSQMGLDEVSRAGQVWIMDWWLARFREAKLPCLRYSSKAFKFKSSQAGVKSIAWWLASGLLDQESMVVNVWVYCFYGWYKLVEMLVDGHVQVSFAPIPTRTTWVWPRIEESNQRVAARIQRWWESSGMREKTGLDRFQSLDYIGPAGASKENVWNWSRVLEKS